MAFSFHCPRCSNVLQAESAWSGQQTNCPFCGNTIAIPDFSSAGSVVSPPGGAAAGAAEATIVRKRERDGISVRLCNGLFGALRKWRLWGFLGRSRKGFVQFGVWGYGVLGVLLFIGFCIHDTSFQEFLEDAGGGIRAIIFGLLGACVFRLCDDLSERTESSRIPAGVANVIAAFSLYMTISLIFESIVETCTQDRGMIPLYEHLGWMFIWFPFFLTGMAPSLVSVRIGEASPQETVTGILDFLLNAVLFAIPFWWAFEAFYRSVNLVCFLGASKMRLAQALEVSSDKLDVTLLLPFLFYVGYLPVHLLFSVVKRFLAAGERKRNSESMN